MPLIRQRLLLVSSLFATVALAMTVGVAASSSSQPEYTWTLAATGQGGWIGGPLFEDGSVGGGGALATDNGQVVAKFEPTTWTEDADDLITVCFNVIPRKGGGSPSTLCIGPAEVTGTPIHIELFGDDHIFRITETGQQSEQ